MENGDDYGIAVSMEMFNAPGPHAIGQDGEIKQLGIAVNQLVGSSERTITYTIKGTAQAADKVTGTLGISYSDSKLTFPDYGMYFINCFGSQSFEAVPAP